MADDEQFSLCWNNFNSNLSAGFHESLCRGDLVDVTLAAEGQFVKAHRLVLSVCSPYFRKMFTQMPANQHAFVFLKDVSHSALKDLIQFMYCGEVNVKQEALPAFISTAEALQIKGLTDSDPAPSQSPAKPSTPAPQPAPPAQALTSPRVRQRSSTSRSYRIETDDSDDKTTQIVLQATTALPQQTQPTIVQQTSNTTGVVSQKRTAPRSISTPHTKRAKNSADPLEASEPTQIAVQTVTESKATSEAEFIDLPIEMPTKSEPDYTEEAGEVETAEQDTAYVEDDSYGDMKYDESYFTENEEAGTATGGAGATTSTAVVKQSFVDNSYVEQADPSANEAQGKATVKKEVTTRDCGQSEDLDFFKPIRIPSCNSNIDEKKLFKDIIGKKKPMTCANFNAPEIVIKATVKAEVTTKECGQSEDLDFFKPIRIPSCNSNTDVADHEKKLLKEVIGKKKPMTLSTCANFNAPENVIKTSANKHTLTVIKKARLRGICVQCIKRSNASNIQMNLSKIVTYCPQCPGGDWICEPCFDATHK